MGVPCETAIFFFEARHRNLGSLRLSCCSLASSPVLWENGWELGSGKESHSHLPGQRFKVSFLGPCSGLVVKIGLLSYFYFFPRNASFLCLIRWVSDDHYRLFFTIFIIFIPEIIETKQVSPTDPKLLFLSDATSSRTLSVTVEACGPPSPPKTKLALLWPPTKTQS